MRLEKVYVVTMWSGGRPSRKWKAAKKPELLAQGTGMRFTSLDTKLEVEVIGSLSVEEYEQGALETLFPDDSPPTQAKSASKSGSESGEKDDPEPDSDRTLRLL
jgi:hypothetical protein